MLASAPVFLALLALANAYTCPKYEDIRQRSVDPSSFSIDEIAGEWYLVATTEPTTKFCGERELIYNIVIPR